MKYLGTITALSLLTSASFAGDTQTDLDRAYAAELRADAATHSSLLADDSNIDIGATIQFRYMWNNSDRARSLPVRDEDTIGFDFGELSLNFGGSVEGFDFYIETDVNNRNGDIELDEAWVRTENPFFAGSSLRVGQFAGPFSREYMVSEETQLFTTRSFVDGVFGLENVQGIELSWDSDNFRFSGSLNDGGMTSNTAFTSRREADFGVTGRAELLLSGNWDQFNDFTSERGDNTGLMIGGAAHYQTGGETRGTADTDVFGYTFDASFESNGFGVFAAFHGRSTEMPTMTFDDYGFTAQASYRVSDNNEIFVGYDAIMADDARTMPENDMNFVKAGFTHYIAGHAAKFTIDGFYSMDDARGLTGMSSRDALGDSGFIGGMGDGEFALRGQFQLVF